MTGAPDDPAHPPGQGPYDLDPDQVPTTVLRRHGAPPPPRSALARLVLPVVIALVALLALAGAWQTLQDRTATGAEGADPVSGTSPSVSPPPPAQPTPSPSPSPSSTPSKKPSKPSAKPSSGPSAKPSPSPSAAPTDLNRSVPVRVLNATSRSGLAASVAAELRTRGWKVIAVANWRGGGVTRTAIFTTQYPRGVRALQHDLPAAGAVRRPLPGMSTDSLVLVLGPDYPR